MVLGPVQLSINFEEEEKAEAFKVQFFTKVTFSV
jgi:hypothetical protein